MAWPCYSPSIIAATPSPRSLLPMLGSMLIAWTIRLSLLCYGGAIAIELGAGRQRGDGAARWLWTAGCLLFVVHLLCALHFYHGWSHRHVLDHTAEQTERMLGVACGAGVYFSYAFLLLWLADVIWWWARPAAYRRRSAWTHTAIHLYLFFIAFNGAIVFESGPTRWVGLALCVPLAVLILWKTVARPHAATAVESSA
jgi:hypothetical protein